MNLPAYPRNQERGLNACGGVNSQRCGFLKGRKAYLANQTLMILYF